MAVLAGSETGVELLAPPEQAVKSIDNIIRAAINTAPSFIFFKVGELYYQVQHFRGTKRSPY
ncbi:hypothetical protein, partial [Ruthenibacterium lactatiformans]|uniref:hypothetical protein n=1 Tax=Ruthenibacterium lactatiformans TaxID=1550024 RepID=UPI0026DC8EAC